MCAMVSKGGVFSVAVLVAFAFLDAGCATGEDELRYELLFSPDGAERTCPWEDLSSRLAKASDATRRSLIARLGRLLGRDGGYSRVVAARGVMDFLDQHIQYYTPAVVSAIADNVIAIAPRDMDVYSLPVEAFMDGTYRLPRSLEVRLLPQCSVWFEHREHWIYTPDHALPYRWRAYGGAVYVDGKDVMHHPDPYEMKDGFAQFPDERIDLRKALVSGKGGKPVAPEALVGRHEIESVLRVVAPDGTGISLKHKVILSLSWSVEFR